MPEAGNGLPMVATEIEALAAVGYGADVVADADMARDRHSGTPACRRQAQLAMRKRLFLDRASHRLTDPFVLRGSFANDVVQASLDK